MAEIIRREACTYQGTLLIGFHDVVRMQPGEKRIGQKVASNGGIFEIVKMTLLNIEDCGWIRQFYIEYERSIGF